MNERSTVDDDDDDGVEQAARNFLGLDELVAPRVEVLRDAAGGADRIALHCPLDGEEGLRIDILRTRPGLPAWLAGASLCISYRRLRGAGRPLETAATRGLLSRIEKALPLRDEGGVTARRLLAVLSTSRPPETPPSASGQGWRGLLDYYQESALPAAHEAVLLAAMDVGIVQHLAAVPFATLSEIADTCGCEEASLGVVLRALIALGLVEPAEGNGAYKLAVPRDLFGSAASLLRMNQIVRDLWRNQLAKALRVGRVSDRHDEIWVAMVGALAFSHARAPDSSRGGVLDGWPGARAPRCLLDVGAGSGEISAGFLLHDPELRLIAVDYPSVVATARACYERHGLIDRVTVAEGAFYDPSWVPPPGFDAAWVANTMHTESASSNRTLFRKLHDALPPGGRLIVSERVVGSPNDVDSVMNDVLWSLFTERGRAYSVDEIATYLRESGFVQVETTLFRPGIAQLVASKHLP